MRSLSCARRVSPERHGPQAWSAPEAGFAYSEALAALARGDAVGADRALDAAGEALNTAADPVDVVNVLVARARTYALGGR